MTFKYQKRYKKIEYMLNSYGKAHLKELGQEGRVYLMSRVLWFSLLKGRLG